MKRKKMLIIIISLVVLVVVLLYVFVFRNKITSETGKNKYKPGTIKEQKILQPCKNNSNCAFGEGYSYGYLNFDTGIAEVDAVVKEINEKEDELYSLTVNSTLDNDDCKNIKSDLNFSHYYGSQYITYENDKYASIGVIYFSHDLCSNEYYGLRPNSYIYDKISKKMLSQEEFKKKIDLSDETIYMLIEDNILMLNNNGNNYTLQDKYKDITLYFSEDGNLYLTYYQKDADIYLTIYVYL